MFKQLMLVFTLLFCSCGCVLFAQVLDPALDPQINQLLVEGDSLRKAQQLDAALEQYEQSLGIADAHFGPQSLEVAHTNYKLGVFYYNQRAFEESKAFFITSLETFRLHDSSISIDHQAKSAFNIANINQKQGNIEEVLSYGLPLLDFNHNNTSVKRRVVILLADIYLAQDRIDEVINLLEDRLAEAPYSTVFSLHYKYATALIDYQELERAWSVTKGMEQQFLHLDAKPVTQFEWYLKLASLHKKMRLYASSYAYYKQCEDLEERLLSTLNYKNLRLFFNYKKDLADFYFWVGNYQLSEEIYLDLIDHPYWDKASVQTQNGTYVNIAVLFQNIGDFERSKYYLEAYYNRIKSIQGLDSDIFFNGNMSNHYFLAGDYDAAERFALLALEGIQESAEYNSAHSLKLYTKLAAIAYKRANFQKGVHYIQLGLKDIQPSTKNRAYCDALRILADNKMAQGNYAEAEELLNYGLEGLDTYQGADSRQVRLNFLKSQIEWNIATQNKLECISLVQEFIDEVKLDILNIFGYLPSTSRERYLNNIANVKIQQVMHWCAQLNQEALYTEQMELTMFLKGLQLQVNSSIKAMLSSGKYPELNQLQDSIKLLQEKDNAAYSSNEAIYRLERKLQESFFLQVSNQLNKQSSIAYLERKIKKGTVFIQFLPFMDKDNQVNFGALVYRKNKAIEWIPLCSKEAFLSHIEMDEEETDDVVSRGIRVTKTIHSKDLFRMIWTPIFPYLNKGDKIYYSPTGALNLINLATLQNLREVPMLAQFDLQMVSSVRQIKKDKSFKINTSDHILLVGGLNYNPPTHSNQINSSFNWPKLAGSLQELETISQLFQGNSNIELMMGDDGTEDKLSTLLSSKPSPKFIHFATHGHFEMEELGVVLNETERSSMERSYMVLSGANRIDPDSSSLSSNQHGILSAKEIAALNLKGTELVVLSACNSGLGTLSDYEGVLGLARAFKLAGVQYVLIALSPIEDEGITLEFMQQFYAQLARNKHSIPNVFRTVQLEMLDKYKLNTGWTEFALYK